MKVKKSTKFQEATNPDDFNMIGDFIYKYNNQNGNVSENKSNEDDKKLEKISEQLETERIAFEEKSKSEELVKQTKLTVEEAEEQGLADLAISELKANDEKAKIKALEEQLVLLKKKELERNKVNNNMANLKEKRTVQFATRLTETTHNKLKARAVAEDRTIIQIIERAINSYCDNNQIIYS